LDWKNLRALVCEHYQLIGVLVAASIILFSMGTYTNWDAQTEFTAASSVVTRGLPYANSVYLIDQPPFAFYMTAPILQLMGSSYVNGVSFVTALGLGCVVLMYALGTVLYGKRSGLAAAALFGLVPWQVFMARTYLIDVQYMFLSLMFLFTGILAVKRNSQKLLATAGVLFALAFLTKLFAIFLLIPLVLVVLLKGKGSGLKLTLKNILIFLVPSFIFQALWFGGFANQNFYGVYQPSDFTHPAARIADPSLTFLPRIFVESAGWFLPAAAVFAVVLAVGFRRLFARTLWVDVVCVATILVVVGVDSWLVLGSHLSVPYTSAFKYDYAALPFLCLLAASLIDKAGVLMGSLAKRSIKLLTAGFGVVLVFASMFESIVFLNRTESYPLVDFKVDYIGHYFPFNVLTQVSSNFQLWHYVAVALIFLSMASPFLVRSMRWRLSLLIKILSS